LSKAVNAPLQQRSVILDLDYDRANALPADYDTDLESDWSNLSKSKYCLTHPHPHTHRHRRLELFADGDDFSWSTIEKNRNLFYQQELVSEILSLSLSLSLSATHQSYSFDLLGKHNRCPSH
jgi:hypothetical protein